MKRIYIADGARHSPAQRGAAYVSYAEILFDSHRPEVGDILVVAPAIQIQAPHVPVLRLVHFMVEAEILDFDENPGLAFQLGPLTAAVNDNPIVNRDLQLDDPTFTTNEPLRLGTRLCRGAVGPSNLNHFRVKPGRAFGLRVAGVAKQWVGEGRKLSAAFTFAPVCG